MLARITRTAPTAVLHGPAPQPTMFLADYLDAAMARPWAWGTADCCFFAGDWIAAATGRDPLEPYRGLYDSAKGAARLVARNGGLSKMVDREMVRCGFARTSAPEQGDIAILPMPAAPEHVAAGASLFIADGPWWIGRGLDGVTGLRVRLERVISMLWMQEAV